MSSLVVAALVIGPAALIVAGYALSQLVHVLQIDARRAGAIVDRPGRRVPVARPPELEALERLAADALTSGAAADEVHRMLARLARSAPGGPVAIDPPPGRGRQMWLATSLARLEQAWDLPSRTG